MAKLTKEQRIVMEAAFDAGELEYLQGNGNWLPWEEHYGSNSRPAFTSDAEYYRRRPVPAVSTCPPAVAREMAVLAMNKGMVERDVSGMTLSSGQRVHRDLDAKRRKLKPRPFDPIANLLIESVGSTAVRSPRVVWGL